VLIRSAWCHRGLPQVGEWSTFLTIPHCSLGGSSARKTAEARGTASKDWQMALDVNVVGTWLCCKAVYPYMKERRYGRIVNTSSMAVPTGVPGFLHYVSSKSAIVGLTRSLARELGEHGIAVNTISPCYIPHDEGYLSRQHPAMGPAIMNEQGLERETVPQDLVGTLH
jgi:3-oxoacyl-[acyl-carrier protein] reductase